MQGKEVFEPESPPQSNVGIDVSKAWLSPEAYPYLPAPAVRTTAASDYAALVAGRVA